MKFFIAGLILLVGCVVAVPTDVSLVTAERASKPKCKGTATYKITFRYQWTRARHPDAYPSFAHFSPLVAASHSPGYCMWKPYGFATRGVEDVAETGSTFRIDGELNEHLGRNVYDFAVDNVVTSDGSETVSVTIDVDGKRSLVSAISMIAPSPDWITGFYNIDVCDQTTGVFMKSLTGKLGAWDAGTEDGTNFSISNSATDPTEQIEDILQSVFGGRRLGSYKIRKL